MDEPPTRTEEGEPEHEPETGGRTVIVTGAEFLTFVKAPAMPPVTVQVAM